MKSLIRKIFGGGEEAKGSSQVQRSPRVRIPTLDPAVFVAANGKTYPLRNLSETGLALVAEGERFPDEVSGEIVVGGLRVGAELQVVRRMGSEVGIQFAGDPMEVRGLLRRVFVDELHAQQMTEVDSERQKAPAAGKPRWFYAPGNYELFYVEDAGKITRFELEWNGNFMVYAAEAGLRFGKIDRNVPAEADKAAHAKSALVSWGPLEAEDRRKAARMLENIRGLEADARREMQGLLA